MRKIHHTSTHHFGDYRSEGNGVTRNTQPFKSLIRKNRIFRILGWKEKTKFRPKFSIFRAYGAYRHSSAYRHSYLHLNSASFNKYLPFFKITQKFSGAAGACYYPWNYPLVPSSFSRPPRGFFLARRLHPSKWVGMAIWAKKLPFKCNKI